MRLVHNYFRKNGKDVNTFIVHTKNDFRTNTNAYQQELDKIYLRDGDLFFGIFSTSKIWNNIQMWAHYSAKHTGFCVGFNRDLLHDFIPQCNSASVNYLRKYPLIDPFDDFIQKTFLKSHSKEKNWSYENEYRFYMNTYPEKLSRAKRKVILPQECFNAVMLGLYFPKDQIQIIRRLTEKIGIPLYQIIKDNQSYNLKRIKIN